MQRRLFGAFLVAEGYVTEAQLQLALEHQARLRQTRVGDILVAQGAIPRAGLERAALEQIDVAGRRLRIGEFLVTDGHVQTSPVAPAKRQHPEPDVQELAAPRLVEERPAPPAELVDHGVERLPARRELVNDGARRRPVGALRDEPRALEIAQPLREE